MRTRLLVRLVAAACIGVLIVVQLLQLDRVRVWRARAVAAVHTRAQRVADTMRDPEKRINIGSLVRDREDTMVWDREIAARIRQHGPIDEATEAARTDKIDRG